MKTVSYDGKWKGEVVLYSPLSIDQEAEWEFAIGSYNKAQKKGGGLGALCQAFLPGILACVSEWHLDGLPERMTAQNFPVRPKDERTKLVQFLVTNISAIFAADDDPNE